MSNNKLPIVIGFRFMQEIYLPLNRYRKSISSCPLPTKLYFKDLVVNARDNCKKCDISLFVYKELDTYNKTIDSLHKIYDKYYRSCGNAFFGALEVVYNAIINEFDF